MKHIPFLSSSFALIFFLAPYFSPLSYLSTPTLFPTDSIPSDNDTLSKKDTLTIDTLNKSVSLIPIANDDTLVIRNKTPELYNVLVNDYKGYDNKVNQLSILRKPKGKLAIKRMGDVDMILYQANYKTDEPDGFVYQICNDNGDCDSATVYIIKCPAKSPSFPQQEKMILRYGETKEFNYFGKVIYPSPSTKKRPLYGNITMSADSSLLFYQPADGFVGLDRLNFTVYENWDYCGLNFYESVNNLIYVLPSDETNAAPVALTDEVILKAHKTIKIKPLENDYDPENTLEERIVSISMPKKGKARYSSRTVTYTPAKHFKKGTDEMTYQICDYNGACTFGKIIVKMTANGRRQTANGRR